MTALEKIKTLRGMTKQVAESCGISPSTVSEWEQVPLRHVATVADLLDMTPAEIRPDLAALFTAR